MFSTEKFEKLMNLPEGDFLNIVGNNIQSDDLGMRPKNRQDRIRLAKKYLEELKYNIHFYICSNEVIKEYLQKPDNYRKVDIGAILFDILSNATFGIPFPVIQLTVLIMREGIHTICHNGTK